MHCMICSEAWGLSCALPSETKFRKARERMRVRTGARDNSGLLGRVGRSGFNLHLDGCAIGRSVINRIAHLGAVNGLAQR